jgi:hypothetical protein
VTTILLDGLNEETFRRSIESRLRQGLAAEAVEKLRGLLAPYAGPGRILPERFLTVQVSDLTLSGWEQLGEAVSRHDRPGGQVTAISIAFGWPGDDLPVPDPDGKLRPLIEVGFFTDEAFPFSQSAREDLLDGYSYHGCTWANDNAATETCLSLEGIDDLHGALAALEERLLASDEPDPDEISAGSLGACLLSALLYRAVSERTQRDGLPRPLCVLAGSNGVYPYFDAPVAGIPDEILKAGEPDDEALSLVPGPRYSSLLVTGIPRARKRAVLVLDESEEDKALRTADLRNLAQSDDSAAADLSPAAGEPADLGDPAATITPLPNGPLMIKKKPSEAWDFRDMLGPREPDLPASAPESEPSDPSPVDEAPLPAAPALQRPPVPPFPADPAAERPVEPGFALLEPTIQDRLQSLIAPPVVFEDPQFAAEKLDPAEPEAIAPPEILPPEIGPVWPLGIGYLEDAEAADDLNTDLSEPSSSSLWARLRHWLGIGG